MSDSSLPRLRRQSFKMLCEILGSFNVGRTVNFSYTFLQRLDVKLIAHPSRIASLSISIAHSAITPRILYLTLTAFISPSRSIYLYAKERLRKRTMHGRYVMFPPQHPAIALCWLFKRWFVSCTTPQSITFAFLLALLYSRFIYWT
jgi:hypothetical protein